MTHHITAILSVCSWLVLAPILAQAQISVIQHRDGTSGTITHLGDDVGIYSDAHGNGGPVTGLGVPSFPGTIPHGDATSGTVTTFGTPTPPNHLTTPPVLPMNPNRSLAPQQPPAPLSSGPPLRFTPSSGGRFGR